MLGLLIIIAVVTYFLVSFYSKVKKLPPGPTPLPLIGNFHQIGWAAVTGKGTIALMQEWKQKYGPVFTIWLGPMAGVSIGDSAISNDVMVKRGANLTKRVVFFLLDIVRNGRGIISSNGQHWLEQRRFSLHTLRNFGLGKNLMQERIMLEYDSRRFILEKEVEEAGGEKSIDIFHFLERAIGNIINRIVFSVPFEEGNEDRFFKLKHKMDDMMEHTSIFDMLMNEWNCTRWPMKSRYEKLCGVIQDQVDFIKEEIDKRKAEVASGEHIIREGGEDFVDAYLLEMQQKDHGDSFTDDTLAITILDLWSAGQETTATTLYWAFTYLVLNSEVTKKLKEEVDEVTGRSRSLTLTDKQNTPYLNAIITEVFRVATLGAFSFGRETVEDTVVDNFLIPKGTAITAQMSIMFSDPTIFSEPEKFRPERFIENPSLEEHVPAFGYGKRACLGESLARAEIYLIIGNFALNFDFNADSEHPASMKAADESGIMRKAQPYKMIVSRRG